jgi:hypothetical protein
VCQAFLTGLNYHWTLQLVVKVLRSPRAGKGSGGKGSGGRSRVAAGAAAAAAAAADDDGGKYGKHL